MWMCPRWNTAKSQSLEAQQDEVIVSDNTHTKVYLARSGMRVRNASVGSVSPLRCTLAAHILGTLAATAAAAVALFVKTWFPTRTSSVGRFSVSTQTPFSQFVLLLVQPNQDKQSNNNCGNSNDMPKVIPPLFQGSSTTSGS